MHQLGRVHCTGIMVVDLLCRLKDGYPTPPTRNQVNVTESSLSPGGGAVNSSKAMAGWGFSTGLFSLLGTDPNGDFLLEQLERSGIDLSGVKRTPAASTPFTLVGLDRSGERSFIHLPGANQHFSLDHLDLDPLFACDLLFYQDLFVLPQLDGHDGARLLKKAREKGVTTALDACWGLGPDRPKLEVMLPHVDYFLPSVTDMAVIYPGLSAEEMGHHFLNLGCRHVIIKRGAEGCLAMDRERSYSLPTAAAQILDTTGAGDCFDAGFLGAILRGKGIYDACLLGSVAAKHCLSKPGGTPELPDWDVLAREAEDFGKHCQERTRRRPGS